MTPRIDWSRGAAGAGREVARRWMPGEVLPLLDPCLGRQVVADFWWGVGREMLVTPPSPLRWERVHPSGETEPDRGTAKWHAWRASLVPSPEAQAALAGRQAGKLRRRAWVAAADQAGHPIQGLPLCTDQEEATRAEWSSALESRGWDRVHHRGDGGVSATSTRGAAVLRADPVPGGGWWVEVTSPAYYVARTCVGAESQHSFAATRAAVARLRAAEEQVSRSPFHAASALSALDGLPSLGDLITLDGAARDLVHWESTETSWRSRPASDATPEEWAWWRRTNGDMPLPPPSPV